MGLLKCICMLIIPVSISSRSPDTAVLVCKNNTLKNLEVPSNTSIMRSKIVSLYKWLWKCHPGIADNHYKRSPEILFLLFNRFPPEMALTLQNCSTLQLEVAKNKNNASEMENESIPEIDNAISLLKALHFTLRSTQQLMLWNDSGTRESIGVWHMRKTRRMMINIDLQPDCESNGDNKNYK